MLKFHMRVSNEAHRALQSGQGARSTLKQRRPSSACPPWVLSRWACVPMKPVIETFTSSSRCPEKSFQSESETVIQLCKSNCFNNPLW
jgi:hypothetical protein